ncbi:hypothetical protein ABDF71_21885 [Ochrobactrum sp. WV_118_8]
MVTVSGALPFPSVPFPVARTTIKPTDGLVVGDYGVLHTQGASYGSFHIEQPVNFLPRHYIGARMRSYFEDYYERVWFVPTTLDFGPITATTSKQVYVWNAHLRPTTLNQITMPDDTTITLSGLTPPTTFHALGGAFFDVWVDANGQPSIDDEFTFQFLPVETVKLRTVGIRSRLWEFPPNWDNGFEVTLEYRSEIITSDSGKEQRRALRQTPRKSFSFNSLVHEERFRRFIRHMSVWQQRSTVVPEFSRTARLAAPLYNGFSSASVEVVPDWLKAGSLVVLMDRERALLRTIEGVSGNTVSFSSSIEGDWLAGSRLFSALSGRLATSIQATQHTNRTATVGLSFNADPGLEDWADPAAPSVTHLGREVFLKRPNWGASVSPEFAAVIEQVDYGVGRIDNYLPILFNDRLHKAEYLGVNVGNVKEYTDFFRRQFGQVGEFFMPTFTEDLQIKLPSPATTSNLRIEGAGTADDYTNGTVYRDLIVFLADGSYLLRHVQSIYQVDDAIGNDSIIQVTEPWPVELSDYNVRQICWMPLWRLLSDSMTIQYVTDEAAQFALNMKTLEYNDAEG